MEKRLGDVDLPQLKQGYNSWGAGQRACETFMDLIGGGDETIERTVNWSGGATTKKIIVAMDPF